MYLMFPIGIMYYFGTNLDNRFAVEGFWPKAEHSHKIPFEREEMKKEYVRLMMRQRQVEQMRKEKEARDQPTPREEES